jgi:ElaA protein
MENHPVSKDNIYWTCTPFEKLSTLQLYRILQLRSQVFIVEQDCPYQDADGKDLHAYHLCAWEGEQAVAYARLLPPGTSYTGYASIGRVVTALSHRRFGIGKELMKQALLYCSRLFEEQPVKISAQLYLKKFYESFGFEAEGDIYLEDDIEHIAMKKMLL